MQLDVRIVTRESESQSPAKTWGGQTIGGSEFDGFDQ